MNSPKEKQKKQLIKIKVEKEQYELDMKLSSTVARIVKRYKTSGYYRQNITTQQIDVYMVNEENKEQKISHQSILKDLKKNGKQIYFKLYDSQKRKSQFQQGQGSIAVEQKSQIISQVYDSKQLSQVYQPVNKCAVQIHQQTMKSQPTKSQINPEISVDTFQKMIKEVQKQTMDLPFLPYKLQMQLQNLHKKYLENKTILKDVLQTLSSFPQQYKGDDVNLQNLVQNLEELKIKLQTASKQKEIVKLKQTKKQIKNNSKVLNQTKKKQPHTLQSNIVYKQISDNNKLCSHFLGNLLNYKRQRQIIKVIEQKKKQSIIKMKSLFHYEDMFCTEGMHYMIHNRCENFENILFFVQTQDDNIFGGFTFGSLKKNTKSSDIFLWVDQRNTQSFAVDKMMKYNPFSCLVLGKNELELTIRENKVKIKYNEVDESAFIEELQENFQKINGLKVKSFEFLMVQFREKITFIDGDD